jgi:hypothetical protein
MPEPEESLLESGLISIASTEALSTAESFSSSGGESRYK